MLCQFLGPDTPVPETLECLCERKVHFLDQIPWGDLYGPHRRGRGNGNQYAVVSSGMLFHDQNGCSDTDGIGEYVFLFRDAAAEREEDHGRLQEHTGLRLKETGEAKTVGSGLSYW